MVKLVVCCGAWVARCTACSACSGGGAKGAAYLTGCTGHVGSSTKQGQRRIQRGRRAPLEGGGLRGALAREKGRENSVHAEGCALVPEQRSQYFLVPRRRRSASRLCQLGWPACAAGGAEEERCAREHQITCAGMEGAKSCVQGSAGLQGSWGKGRKGDVHACPPKLQIMRSARIPTTLQHARPPAHPSPT